MISTTLLAGDLGDCFFLENGEPFRYVKVTFIGATAGERPREMTYEIPVHAFGGSQASFYTLKKGSKVILKGWLESREKIGVVVISELEELFPKRNEPTTKKKTANK